MNGLKNNHIKRLPSLTALKTFESVARLVSFKDAAEELFVTPSAVSHQMRQLEDFLGIKLIQRNPRSINLTDEGKEYFEAITKVFNDIYTATSNIVSKRKNVVLCLDVPNFFYMHWLKNHIDGFLDSFSEVELRIVDHKKAKPKNDLRDEVKVNILWGNKKVLEAENTLFLNSPAIVVCSPDILHHTVPFTDKKFISSYNQLHMSLWPYAWEYIANNLGIESAAPEKIKYFDYTGDLIDAVLAGEGIAICDKIVVQDYLSSGKLISVFDFTIPSNNSFYLTYEPELAENYILKGFKEWISAESNKIVND